MKAIHNTSFLCGSFSIRKERKDTFLIDRGWEKIVRTREDQSLMEKFYYPEFVSFCYQTAQSKPGEGMMLYRLPVEEEIEITLREDRMHKVTVHNIELFILPYDLLIYSIQIKQDGAELDDITASLSLLRNISYYKDEFTHGSWGRVLSPIVELYRAWSVMGGKGEPSGEFRYFDLMENGNKLKLFQVVEVDITQVGEKEQEELLFELGTLAPVDSYSTQNFSSPSRDYFERIMKQNKISIFNNWKGLSLFDTFTILSYPTHSYLLDNWINTYFGMIYIHSLFLKFYLFRMNIRFRKKESSAVSLEEEFIAFERNYCFHKISYNFLPLEIYSALDTGLEINEERKLLYHMIEQEKNMQEKASDNKMNHLLFFLTILTLSSTIWDFTSLFDQLYPYEEHFGSSVLGYRLITTLMMSVILIVILINRLWRRKE